MFERAPFQRCPRCQLANSFGILSAGGSTVRRRCTRCRFSLSDDLPQLDKKVVYLDQLAISEIFKTKTGARRRVTGKEGFWRDVEREVNRAYLLQQVIFPASTIHWDETIVSAFAAELSSTHGMMSGDTSFCGIDEINTQHVREFANAYLEKRSPPALAFHVDDILKGERNDWLPDLHISAEMDFSMFAQRVRNNRDAAGVRLNALVERWKRDKPTFEILLETEIKSYGPATCSALLHALNQALGAIEKSDPLDIFEATSHPLVTQFQELRAHFERFGIDSSRSTSEVCNFLNWSGNEFLPTHRVSAYLFAGLARKLVAGQKRLPSRGIFNDINAIATYGHYVDAMFVDNECAQLLSERPLSTEIKLKAKIFSMRSGTDFIDFLQDLQNRAPPEVRHFVGEIYGLQ